MEELAHSAEAAEGQAKHLKEEWTRHKLKGLTVQVKGLTELETLHAE